MRKSFPGSSKSTAYYIIIRHFDLVFVLYTPYHKHTIFNTRFYFFLCLGIIEENPRDLRVHSYYKGRLYLGSVSVEVDGEWLGHEVAHQLAVTQHPVNRDVV